VVGNTPTPLAAKLGIREESTLAILDAPDGLVLELPPGTTVRHQARGQADVVLAFFTRVVRLERRADALAAMVHPSGGLWIAWPKRSSGMETDLTDHAVRRLALHRGLVDNKVCAIDATWTALRLVWRVGNRAVQRPG
jgi:hypothetical protein